VFPIYPVPLSMPMEGPLSRCWGLVHRDPAFESYVITPGDFAEHKLSFPRLNLRPSSCSGVVRPLVCAGLPLGRFAEVVVGMVMILDVIPILDGQRLKRN